MESPFFWECQYTIGRRDTKGGAVNLLALTAIMSAAWLEVNAQPSPTVSLPLRGKCTSPSHYMRTVVVDTCGLTIVSSHLRYLLKSLLVNSTVTCHVRWPADLVDKVVPSRHLASGLADFHIHYFTLLISSLGNDCCEIQSFQLEDFLSEEVAHAFGVPHLSKNRWRAMQLSLILMVHRN